MTIGGIKIPESKQRGSYKKLNIRQRIFCDELLADESFNATEAARKAGYKYPKASAQSLIDNENIRKIIGRHVYDRLCKLGYTAEDVLHKLWTILALDPLEAFEKVDDHYEVKNLEDIPKPIRQCITQVKSTVRHFVDGSKEQRMEVHFMSKDKALEYAMKHFGLISPDVHQHKHQTNVNVKMSFQDALEQIENQRNGNGKVIDERMIEEKVG